MTCSKDVVSWLATKLQDEHINDVEASRELFNTLLKRRVMRFRRGLLSKNPLHHLHDHGQIVVNANQFHSPQCIFFFAKLTANAI